MKLYDFLKQIGKLRWENEDKTNVYTTDPADRWHRFRVIDVFRDSDGDIIIECEKRDES